MSVCECTRPCTCAAVQEVLTKNDNAICVEMIQKTVLLSTVYMEGVNCFHRPVVTWQGDWGGLELLLFAISIICGSVAR